MNSLGSAIPLQNSWQRTGEYLIPIGDVLRTHQLDKANVKVVFTLSSGGTGEVTLQELTVYATSP